MVRLQRQVRLEPGTHRPLRLLARNELIIHLVNVRNDVGAEDGVRLKVVVQGGLVGEEAIGVLGGLDADVGVVGGDGGPKVGQDARMLYNRAAILACRAALH